MALVPYVCRSLHADRGRSIRLGAILATSFALVAYADSVVATPGVFAFRLFYLNLIFISYGVAVHRARKVFGASPLFVICLWLPIEYFLNNLAGDGKLFAISAAEPSLALRLSLLLDLLLIPLGIILLNPLLLILASYVIARLTPISRFRAKLPQREFHSLVISSATRHYYRIPVFRGPPSCSSVC